MEEIAQHRVIVICATQDIQEKKHGGEQEWKVNAVQNQDMYCGSHFTIVKLHDEWDRGASTFKGSPGSLSMSDLSPKKYHK